MSLITTDNQHYADIANAIREKNGTENTYKPEQMAAAIHAISGGKETLSWHQCPEAVRNYLADVTYDPSDYTTSQIANYAPAVAVASNTKPIGYNTGGVTYYNDVPNVQTPFANTQTAGTLQPLDRLRWIRCNTAQNVRDLGGWSCDGGTVRYGLLIRGGECGANDADVLVKQCGVLHEMNLRGRQESGRTSSVLGNIGYSIYDSFAWYSLSNTTLWRQMMQTVFDCINNSIPIYFHCSAGADRTGTLACVLEALLGVNQSDIDKDYELTCFYTGTDTDQNGRRRDETEWKNLINAINAYSGSTFRDKAVRFVLSLGFSIADINKFRAVMIDGTPEILVSTTYTVTNTLTHVTNSNSAASIEQYQQYTASLLPSDEYVIDSVRVTMGGTDITSQVFSGTQTVRRFAVTANLTNCHSDAPRTAVDGAALTINLEADEEYTMTGASVTVTMGGTNVSQYYSNGTITIPSVTGDVVITATAVPSVLPYKNWITHGTAEMGGTALFNGVGYQNGKRINSSDTIVDQSSSDRPSFVTGYIPVSEGDTVYLYGNLVHGGEGGTNCKFYASDGTVVSTWTPYSWQQNVYAVRSFTPSNYDSTNEVLNSFTIPSGIAYMRLSLQGTYISGTTVVTINEPIE